MVKENPEAQDASASNEDTKPEIAGKSHTKRHISTHFLIRLIADNAIIGALYFALTFFLPAISYNVWQFRVSEFLVLLCFWRPDLCIGLTIGCALANFASFTIWDVLFGSLATLISCLLVSYASPRLLVSVLWPTLINALVIGAELTWIVPVLPTYWENCLSVAVGEGVVVLASYFLWLGLCHAPKLKSLLLPYRHLSAKW